MTPPAAPPATPPPDLAPEEQAPAAPPSRRGAIARTAVIVVVMVVVFGFILPNAVDYGEVIAAFQRLDPLQMALMSTAGVAAWVVAGAAIVAVIAGLSLLRGAMSWVILSGIGSSIPFGPWNLGVLWVVLRDWGVTNRAATSGLAVYGIVNVLGYLALPLLAAAFLTVSGGFDTAGNPVGIWIIGIVCGAIALMGFGLVFAIATSERVAGWVSRTGQRITDAIFGRLGRERVPNVAQAVTNFTDQLGSVVQRRGLLAMALAVGAHVVWAAVLVASLRIVGVNGDLLPASWIFAAFALVGVVAILPIAPGGAGIPEMMFIGLLGIIAPDVSSADVAAGVFLYRLYFWFLPIPLSWIALKVIRRGRSMLPSGDEMRAYATPDVATE